MDTLHERLSALADDAPGGGVPPAELWARGKRAHRVRVAGVVATVLVVGAVGTAVGVRLAGADGTRSDLEPAGGNGMELPITYPVGEELPDLGDSPGPLAAVWVTPGLAGTPEAVGLVAETGTFGRLSLDVAYNDATPNAGVALSPDGRRIAYQDPAARLTVSDLVTGESYSSGSLFQTQPGYAWIDATTVIGRAVEEGDLDGWVWEPATSFRLVNRVQYAEGKTPDILWYARPDNVGPGNRDWWIVDPGDGPRSCAPPILENFERFEVPALCDVLVIDGNALWGHWNSDRSPGDWDNPTDGNETVVILDPGFAPNAANRRVILTAGAPQRVTFATDLIKDALTTDGGRS
jgi:hypothetical protein